MLSTPPARLRTRHPFVSVAAMMILSTALLVETAGCGDYLACEQTDGEGRCAVLVTGGGGGGLEGFASATRLEHLGLATLLRSYTQAGGSTVLLDYHAMAASPEARDVLDRYVAALGAVDPSKLDSPQERLAFWINGYNAAVIQGVLADYQGSESFQVVGSGTFFDRLLTLGGQQLTLNQVENVIVRGDLQHASAQGLTSAQSALFAKWHSELWQGATPDARLHAAFNCAALSCPSLLAAEPFVYTAATLDAQLASSVRGWLDAEKGASAQGISKLFDWYAKDFVASEGSVEAFIAKHRTGGTQGVALDTFLEYDWTLNIVLR